MHFFFPFLHCISSLYSNIVFLKRYDTSYSYAMILSHSIGHRKNKKPDKAMRIIVYNLIFLPSRVAKPFE